jgi:hypothetical protein
MFQTVLHHPSNSLNSVSMLGGMGGNIFDDSQLILGNTTLGKA